jgi:O-antigen ligase
VQAESATGPRSDTTDAASKTFLPQQGPRLRRGVLVVTVGLIPAIVAYGVGLRDPFNTPKLGVLIFGVATAGALRASDWIMGRKIDGLLRLMVPAAAFSVPFFFAWLASPDRAFALSGWDYGRYQGLVPYLLAVALGMLIADAMPGRAQRVAWALAISGTFVSLYALLQFAGADIFPGASGWTRTGRAVSSLGNPNFTGGFLAISLAAALPLAFGAPNHRRLARAMVYVIAIGVGRSYSQGAWVAALAGAAVASGIFFAGRWSRARKIGIVVATTLAIGSVATVVLAMTGLDIPVLSTVRSRGLTWETSLRAAEDELLLGHGLNSFGQVQPLYRSDEARADQLRRGSVPDDPHSVPLAMLVNGGLVAFFAFVAVAVWFLIQASRVPDGNLTGAALVGAISAYLVQALSSIDEVSLRVTFWACLGALAAYLAPPEKETDIEPSPARVALSTLIVLGGTIAGVVLAVRFMVLHRI